jgi:hypothetical protein
MSKLFGQPGKSTGLRQLFAVLQGKTGVKPNYDAPLRLEI